MSQDGKLLEFTDRNGLSSTYRFDAQGRLVQDIDPSGGGWRLSREKIPGGYQVRMTSGEGRETLFKTIERPHIKNHENILPDGSLIRSSFSTGFARTIFPDLTVQYIRNYSHSLSSWNAVRSQRLTVIQFPSGLEWKTYYAFRSNQDPATGEFLGSNEVFSNGRNRSVVTRFNANENRYVIQSSSGRDRIINVNSLGDPVSITVAGIAPTSIGYDNAGRVVFLQQGTGTEQRKASFRYGTAGPVAGYLVSMTDPMGRETIFERDMLGRVTREIRPDGRQILYTWDAEGRLASIVPPGRPPHLFSYLPKGQMEAYVPPSVSSTDPTTRYTFDLDGLLTSVIRPDGLSITFAYNQGGKLTQMTLPKGVYSYQYGNDYKL